MAVHAFTESALAFWRNQARLIILSDKIIEVVVGFQDYIGATAAVAAAGPALGTILLPLKSNAPFAAMAGTGVNLDLVNKHNE